MEMLQFAASAYVRRVEMLRFSKRSMEWQRPDVILNHGPRRERERDDDTLKEERKKRKDASTE